MGERYHDCSFLFLLLLGAGLIIMTANRLLEKTKSPAKRKVLIICTFIAFAILLFLVKWCVKDFEASFF